MLPSSASQRRGVWEPLSLIVYGYAVHPLSPSHRDTRHSGKARLSTVTEASTEGDFIHRHVVSLEVGDEIYAFEKYTPKGKECDGIWYRGYVVCKPRHPPINWDSLSDPSSSKAVKTDEPQVFIGIFPESHIHVRDELSDAEGRLADVASQANGNKDHLSAWKDGEDDTDRNGRKSFKLPPPPDQANSSRAGLPVYPASLRSISPSESQPYKPLPPRPTLKSTDDTASGQVQPIIDEIASALREWHNLMFLYLARRDYKLLHTVRDHIEALHLGRRQLLAQTLSSEETVDLRKDCVARLVMGNVVQGLDVIVRHPTWGGLITVDVEGEIDPRSWVSAVRMYAMQVSLAYMDVSPDSAFGSKATALGPAAEYSTVGPSATPQSASFPDHNRTKSSTRLLGSLAPPQPAKNTSVKFYHVFLDLKAFVASPCSPGETAELYFSLYNKNDMRFVTEEFCVILNHNGVLARDPSARIRTLFIDLVHSDVQDPIYLVCNIVRNGGMKIGSNFNSTSPLDSPRRGSEGSFRDGAWTDSSTALNGVPGSSAGGRSTPVFDGPSAANFRRPFGCAILELSQLNQFAADHSTQSTVREYQMPIHVPTNEAVYSMLHQDIIAGNLREYGTSARADALAVSVKFFHGDSKIIVKENPSLLQNTPLTARLGFPDVVFPGDVRNEIYIKLWSGEFFTSHSGARLSVANFTRGSISHAANNIQVTIEVRDDKGNAIEKAISQGTSEPPVTQFHSLVFQRNNVPTFGELVKLQLPMNAPPNWHLYFTFRQRNTRERSVTRGTADALERPFAFAFLPLLPDNRAFLEDGSHTLLLYRISSMNQVTADTYLSRLPWTARGQRIEALALDADLLRSSPPIRDNLIIRTSLCSSRFTQNSVLLNLLNWEQIHDRDALATVLQGFVFVGEVEIVKFLRDIFDSLFAILVSSSNPSGELDHHVFVALVTVLGIFQDRRFSNFLPVLDVYIERHFACSSASSHLIQSMNRLLANPSSNDAATPLRAALRVWNYLMRFIIRSRELQKAKEVGIAGGATAEHLESTFKKELQSHLTEVNRMMSTTSPASIIGTQTFALQNFTSILPELQRVFSIVELVSIVTLFSNAIGVGKGKLVIWKLIMYLQVVKGFLFDIAESRSLLVEAVVIWIKPHFGRFDEYTQTQPGDSENARDNAKVNWLESIRLCIAIIAVMLDKLQLHLVAPSTTSDRTVLRREQDNVEYLLSLMPRMLDSYREFQNTDALKALEKTRTGTSLTSAIPVSFPESYPFSLLAQAPGSAPDLPTASTTTVATPVFNCSLAETAVVFLVLMSSSPKKHIINFLESSLEIEGKDNFANLITQFFKVACSILDNEAFPASWLNVNVLAHKVLVKMADPVTTLMEKFFIPEQGDTYQFNAELWREALHMLLKLLSSDQLVIEEFSPQKCRAVWRLAGDIRGEGATILLRLWDALGWPEQGDMGSGSVARFGGYQVSMSNLVGHVVNLCLSHHDQLRNNAVQILYSMIVSEYYASNNFDEIENELVNKLDTLFMSDSKGDDMSRTFFIGQLRHLFDSSDVDEQLRQRVANFLDSVDLFLELLLNVRELPEGDEFADDRVIATLRLMNFIRRIGRDEIYIKYVHQLVNMHLQSQNYVEAGLTLKLHSDLHEWDLTSFVESMEDLGLPRQSHFHRKETLCLLILDYLGKGKAWESAVAICDELAFQHTTVTFNYVRLSEILRHKAALLEHIIADQRYYPDYFRVAFYGSSFPVAIRNKQFVYRGFEWEKLGAFCERMLNKHPGSQLLRSMGDPDPEVRFGSDQYIQCIAVTPEPDRNSPIFNNPDVPSAVRAYYEHSDINSFSCQMPLTKVRNREQETWTLKTFFTTEETFPTVLRRSEVIEVHLEEISPIENAINDVEQKTKELNALNVRYTTLAKSAQQINTNALVMALNGVIDTPSSSGVSAYRQTFLTSDFVSQNPHQVELVQRLRDAVHDQARVIDSCLKLHGSLCTPEWLTFHERLERYFRKEFSEEIRRLSVDTTQVSPSVSRQPRLPGDVDRFHEKKPSQSSTNTVVKPSFYLPPLQLGRQAVTPPPQSPRYDNSLVVPPAGSSSKQTPLQRHLAHLARTGFHGVSSGPGDSQGSDTMSAGSPHGSFVNVLPTIPPASNSGASVVTSNFGTSIGSIKGRFSRLGSLNFGRRE